MHFSPKALLVFVAFFVMVAMTLFSPGSAWVYIADGVVSVIIVLGVAGVLSTHTAQRSQ